MLGEYGQGKSTCALMLTHYALERRLGWSRIPILIELRGKSPKTQTPLELLAAWGAYYGISGSALLALLRAGKLLLIFDGFDEMDGLDDERMRYENFVAIWRFAAIENSKILITGRPELFLDDTELRRDLAVHPDTATGPFTMIAKLQRFEELQIRDALRNVDTATREEIVELARSSSSFFDVVSRPSLLQQVAAIWNDPVLRAKKTEIKSATIIELFLDSTFRRQSEKVRADYSLRFMRLNESELAFFTRCVAAYMASERLPNQITSAQLAIAVQKSWSGMGNDVQFPARPELGEDLQPVRLRLKNVVDPIEVVTTNIRSYGVIVRDYSRGDTFKFSHKSYFELLCAKIGAGLIGRSGFDQHRLITNSFSLTLNDLLVSPVATSFCGELLGFGVSQDNSNAILNKIYDFLARAEFPDRMIPRPLHILVTARLPAFFLARRLIRTFKRSEKLGSFYQEAIAIDASFVYRQVTLMLILVSATMFLASVVIAPLGIFKFWLIKITFFSGTDKVLTYTPLEPLLVPADSLVIKLFLTSIGLAAIVIATAITTIRNVFVRGIANKLMTLSLAAAGQRRTIKYYGRRFARISEIIGRFDRT